MTPSVQLHRKSETRVFVLLIIVAVLSVLRVQAGEIISEASGFVGHLQGIAADETGIYWSFYDTLLKTDYAGKTLASVKIPRHSGDLCVADGKVYVSVTYYDAKMVAESGGSGWVYIYDRELSLLQKKALPDTPRPDGITFLKEKFYIAGDDFGKELHPHNTISIYDKEFAFERKITVNIGKETHYGAQTLNAFNGRILASFYAKDGNTLFLAPPDLKPCEFFPISLNVGFAVIPPELTAGRQLFLAARLFGTRGDWQGKAVIYELRDGKPVQAELQTK